MRQGRCDQSAYFFIASFMWILALAEIQFMPAGMIPENKMGMWMMTNHINF
jgi:hypothetical protein